MQTLLIFPIFFCNIFLLIARGFLCVDHRTNDRKRNKQNGGKNQDRDLSRDNEILNAAVTLSQLSTKAPLIVVTVVVKLMTNFLLFQNTYNGDAVIV